MLKINKYIVKANFNGHKFESKKLNLEYATAISRLIKNKFNVETEIEKVKE